MSNNKRAFISILVLGLGTVLNYLINFFLTSFISDNIGLEAYGFVSIAKTFVSYATILTTVLTVFVVRYISVAYHQNNMKEANGYYASSIRACNVMSIIIFVVAVLFSTRLELFINIPDDLIPSVKLLFVFIFASFFFTTITTPFSTAVIIKNRVDLSGLAKIISYTLEAIVLIALFTWLKPYVWYVGIGSLAAAFFLFLCNLELTKKLTPELHYEKKHVSKDKIKNLVKNGIWSAINQLGNVLNSGLDLLISNLMLSGLETGQLAVAKTMGNIFSTLVSVIYQPLQPQLIKSYASNDTDLYVSELTRAMEVCGFWGALAFSGFFGLGRLYFRLWLPNQDDNVLFMVSMLTVLTYITDSVMRPVYDVSNLTVKNKVPCFITIFGGVVNVVSMYFLLKHTNLGIYAVAGTTVVVMFSINLLFNPIYAAKCLKTSPRPLYQVILKHFLGCIAMTVVFGLIAYLTSPSGWLGLIIEAILMTILGVIMYFFIVFNKEDKDKVLKKVKRKIVKG